MLQETQNEQKDVEEIPVMLVDFKNLSMACMDIINQKVN